MFRSFVFAALNNTVSRLTTTSAKPRPKSALSPGCGKIPKDFEFLKVKNAFRAPDPLNYRYNLIDDKNEQGYKHSYVMR